MRPTIWDLMPRKQSPASPLDRLARRDNERAAGKQPAANAKRVVRRKVQGKAKGMAGNLLKVFGLK